MIKYIISLSFYYIGHLFSKIAFTDWTAEMYQKCMVISLRYDPDGKVWKFVDKDADNNNFR